MPIQLGSLKPVPTKKSMLNDKVIELRYTHRGITYETILGHLVPLLASTNKEDIILANEVQSLIQRYQDAGSQPESCLNKLMDLLG